MQTQALVALTDNPRHQEAEAILRACVHCGFCNAICPTYRLLGDECDGPRGRIYLIKQMLEGSGTSDKTQRHLDRCLTCRACETACPSGVRYGTLLDIGREVMERQTRRSLKGTFKRRLLCSVLPYPRRFKVLFNLARFVAPLLPMTMRRKITVASSPECSRPQPIHSRKVLLLDGCVQPTLAPGINIAAIRVLDRLGISVVTAPSVGCCGALNYHLSDLAQGLDFMRHNINAWLPFLDQGIEAIVTTASGCGLMAKQYGEIFRHDAIYRKKAEHISAATLDLAELLAAEDLAVLKPIGRPKVAFHSPCTLQHGQQLGGVVETLLQGLGFQLIEVADAQLCCGSAGAYSLLQPEISERLLENKVANLESGQPEVIATANIGCLAHIRNEAHIPVRHWIEVLDEALPEQAVIQSS